MNKLFSLSLSCLILSGCEVVDFAATDAIPLEVELETEEIDSTWNARATVHATMSLYYLFDQSEGPFGEEGADYVPATVTLPAGVRRIQVEAAQGTWGWSSSKNRNISDANGGYLEATRSEYHSVIRSFNELPVGSLVGMWSDGTENSEEGLLQPFYIGSEAELEVPPGAKALILGMHDGYEWTNNWGSREVTVSESHSDPLP